MATRAKAPAKQTVSHAETIAIQAFLSYLQKNWSKLINPNDASLVAAISAWFHQESGGLSHIVGNNPFNIRLSPLQMGQRTMKGNGQFAVFRTMAQGWEAAAYLLVHGNPLWGYQLALNALKVGGGEGASGFLAAMSMSKWDAGHYGVHNWQEAYDPTKNHLLRNYNAIGGVQLAGPPAPTPARTVAPELPQAFNYQVSVRNYLDPWAAASLYARRHSRGTM